MNGLGDFDLLTIAEVAELLHCSKAHVCNVIAGRVSSCSPIPTVRLGRRKLVRRPSLVLWIDDNERSAASDNLKTSPERGRKSA
jgi:hypothetical protein